MNGKVNGKYNCGKSHPLFGQMSSFYFFQEPLSEFDMKLISEIDIKNFSSWIPGVAGSPGDSKLLSKLLFAYSPKASTCQICFNLALKPTLTKNTKKNGVLVGARVVKISHLIHSIQNIGGVTCLFPFFESFGIGGQFEWTVIGLLREILRDKTNQEQMINENGFAVLGSILGKLSPKALNREIVVEWAAMAHYLDNGNINYIRVRPRYNTLLVPYLTLIFPLFRDVVTRVDDEYIFRS